MDFRYIVKMGISPRLLADKIKDHVSTQHIASLSRFDFEYVYLHYAVQLLTERWKNGIFIK